MNELEKNKLITIGIPFYNSERFLADAIKSVINQSFKNWQLILIDDGSGDKSVEIAESFIKIDHRIHLYSDGKNLGLPTRLNELINLTTTKYYCRMDADDIMHPERLKEQYEFLLANPEIDLLGSSLITLNNENEIIGIRGNTEGKNFTLKQMLVSTWCVHPTIMGRTAWFKKNPYNENLKRGQDYDLWIRTVENSNFYKQETPYLFYREASTSSLLKYISSTKYAFKTYWNNKERIGLSDYLILVIKKCFKLLVYLILSTIGRTNYLIKRRSLALSRMELKHYNQILNRAIN